MIDLLARNPAPDPAALTAELAPSARFEDVRFETYRPNADYPSQAEARASLGSFVGAAQNKPSGLRLFRRRRPEGKGLYLDGGFGVGKTHLLASAYHASDGTRAIMSFQDLMYLIGALGMTRAVDAFRGHDLLLIDEFELDDPGNTHMANTFLGQLMPGGTSVIATSNTEPGALGQGRFNAGDFQRQIQGIASRFETHRLDGPDFRQRGTRSEDVFSAAEYAAWEAAQNPETLAVLTHRELNRHLLNIHPSLLPAFAGLKTHQRAIEMGCRFAGATVHRVTSELDHGEILAQAVVPVLPGDTPELLAGRVLTQEHLMYPLAVERLLEAAS